MKWKGRRGSRNIEDRRGAGGRRRTTRLRLPGGFGRGGSGRGRGIRGRMGSRGIGGIGMVVFVLIALYFGIDPGMLLQDSPGLDMPPPSGPQAPRSAEEEELAAMVSVVLADTEETWHGLFEQTGGSYVEPKLVLFTDSVGSACGYAQAAMGPFYCPRDQKVYIDLSFYRDLKSKLGAPGDFAQAYVIAHEVAHHVQTLLGISEKVHALRQKVGEVESNALSVRMELQADCLAGLWAQHADRRLQIIEAGDIAEALNAASAIGDDRLQHQSGRAVVPDSFTHGSSAQRVGWFERGLGSSDMQSCDTFSVDKL
jgi:predicted metalloprotease